MEDSETRKAWAVSHTGDNLTDWPQNYHIYPWPHSYKSKPSPSVLQALSNPFGVVWDYISWVYFQYLFAISLPMMEPWEIRMFNICLLVFIAMACYTTYLFLPGHLLMWSRIISDITGSSERG